MIIQLFHYVDFFPSVGREVEPKESMEECITKNSEGKRLETLKIKDAICLSKYSCMLIPFLEWEGK